MGNSAEIISAFIVYGLFVWIIVYYLYFCQNLTYLVNPFISSLLIEVNRYDTSSYIMDKDGDYINDKYDGDCNPPVRIYYDSSVFDKLSPSACKFFIWMIGEIKHKSDEVSISQDKYKRDCGVSTNTIKKAMYELMENRVIAVKNKRLYWINPQFVLRGNRVQKYSKHLRLIKDYSG